MDELISKVRDLAKDVYRHLGPGHLEAPYQKAMEVGLRLRNLKFEAQKVIEIKYEDHYVGDCNLDLLIDDRLAVELKAAGQQAGAPERQQLLNYMRLLNVNNGLLINFAKPGRSKKAGAPGDEPEITLVTLGEDASELAT